MEKIRIVEKYSLNVGTLQADGLFNIADNTNPEYPRLSLWFGSDVKQKLMKLSDDNFIKKCEDFIKDAESYER